MPHQFTTSYLEDVIALLRSYKDLAERAMAQVSDADLTRSLDPETNSIALTVKHMAGNMRSRWTDFLTTDGEKPDRNRDAEFEEPPATREAVLSVWNAGWELTLATLASLTSQDLSKTVTIRGENHSVMQALNRQVAHYSYHCGQIVQLAKHFASAHWQSLTVPRRKPASLSEKPSA
jgi:hypothetical protein